MSWQRSTLCRSTIVNAVAFSLMVSGCSSPLSTSTDATKAEDTKRRSKAPKTLATLDSIGMQLAAEETTILLSLMRDSGLETELGGPVASASALRALSIQFRGQIMGPQANIARFMKIADASASEGYTGFSAGYVSATLLIKSFGTDSAVNAAPGVVYTQKNAENQITAALTDGVANASADFSGTTDGMTGRIAVKVKFDACPKSDGSVRISIDYKSSLTGQKSGNSVNSSFTSEMTKFVGDDSEYDGMRDDVATRLEMATSGGIGGQNGTYVDVTMRTNGMVGANVPEVNRTSSKATSSDVQTAKDLAQIASLLAYQASWAAEERFKSGQCVTLNPTSDPAKRNGVKPSTSFAILAAPRSKIDGMPTKGSVKADLTGDGKLDPAGTKVPADAKFTYVAPDAKDKKGSIAFEARSKRGIGKATLAFDTVNRAYSAVGGSANGQLRGSGNICSLSAPFVLTGSGVTQNFIPSGETGGSYSYSGAIAGIRVYGKGTYTVNADENGGTLTATGPGSVVTPMGVYTDSDTETYKLAPISECRN